jgi:hypothetical protein
MLLYREGIHTAWPIDDFAPEAYPYLAEIGQQSDGLWRHARQRILHVAPYPPRFGDYFIVLSRAGTVGPVKIHLAEKATETVLTDGFSGHTRNTTPDHQTETQQAEPDVQPTR